MAPGRKKEPLGGGKGVSPPSCISPTGCIVGEPIDPLIPEDAVKVICSNIDCSENPWIHAVCFDGWEDELWRGKGGRGGRGAWGEKRGVLWTKRHDFSLKNCACKCEHGQLRKDISYTPEETIEEDKTLEGKGERRRRRRTNSRPFPQPSAPQHPAPRLRSRTLSLGSGAGILESLGGRERVKSETNGRQGYFNDFQVAKTGSIFQRRESLSAFYQILPKWKVNGIHIKMEDDCPQGNDDTRIFLLTTLGDHQRREMNCVICGDCMGVYDRYPLVNGTFFLSPVNHRRSGIPVRHEARDSFLHSACVVCMETASPRLSCGRCSSVGWFPGQSLILGSLYSYDILASSPCCPPECSVCHAPLPLPHPTQQQRHYSAFSEHSNCPQCGHRDAHYVRRLETVKLHPPPPPLSHVVIPANQHVPCSANSASSHSPLGSSQNGSTSPASSSSVSFGGGSFPGGFAVDNAAANSPQTVAAC